MLQADSTDTTNQLIALGVSAQLRTAGIVPPEAANATLLSLIASPPFSPSLAVRWLNCLFFLSLVLSLAAAFFGIRAKQWVREYLKWNAPLSTPRENVLVRQVRMEGWDDWNVDATISSIPALLEVAMILFLAGVTILVWTLDSIVAIVVTVTVVVFLLAVTSFTVLPILFTRCPYRSPTAWICVRMLDLVRCTAPMYILLTVEALAIRLNLRDARYSAGVKRDRFSIEKSWRHRDLGVREASPPWWARADVVKGFRREIYAETLDMADEGMSNPAVPYEYTYRVRNVVQDILETSIATRALSWVHEASQDTRISRYISESLQTVHYAPDPNGSDSQNEQLDSTTLLPTWCLFIGAGRNGDFRKPLQPFLRTNPNWNVSSSPIRQLRRWLSLTVNDGTGGGVTRRTTPLNDDLTQSPFISFNRHLAIVIGILSSDLRASTNILQKLLSSPCPEGLDRYSNRATCIRRTYELVNALCQTVYLWEASYCSWNDRGGEISPSWSDTFCIEGLSSLLDNSHAVANQLNTSAPGLRFQAFRLACSFSEVSLHATENHYGESSQLY